MSVAKSSVRGWAGGRCYTFGHAEARYEGAAWRRLLPDDQRPAEPQLPHLLVRLSRLDHRLADADRRHQLLRLQGDGLGAQSRARKRRPGRGRHPLLGPWRRHRRPHGAASAADHHAGRRSRLHTDAGDAGGGRRHPAMADRRDRLCLRLLPGLRPADARGDGTAADRKTRSGERRRPDLGDLAGERDHRSVGRGPAHRLRRRLGAVLPDGTGLPFLHHLVDVRAREPAGGAGGRGARATTRHRHGPRRRPLLHPRQPPVHGADLHGVPQRGLRPVVHRAAAGLREGGARSRAGGLRRSLRGDGDRLAGRHDGDRDDGRVPTQGADDHRRRRRLRGAPHLLQPPRAGCSYRWRCSSRSGSCGRST